MIGTYATSTATWKARSTQNDYGEFSTSSTTIYVRKINKTQLSISGVVLSQNVTDVYYTTSAVNQGDFIDDKLVKEVRIRRDLGGSELFRECYCDEGSQSV
jgi:hypothetical protein